MPSTWARKLASVGLVAGETGAREAEAVVGLAGAAAGAAEGESPALTTVVVTMGAGPEQN